MNSSADGAESPAKVRPAPLSGPVKAALGAVALVLLVMIFWPRGQGTAAPGGFLLDGGGRPSPMGSRLAPVTLVHFWATWCPPCRSTLEWLGELQRKHGDNLAILALAVESPEDKIRSTVSSLSPDLHWAITDASTAQSFGDITAVPTLFLFDRSGKTSRILYGAPPDLHSQVETSLDTLLK